jgi:uncharacterized damage-inducible protein DinB
MKITELLAENLIQVFEGGNWTEVSMRDALSDVSYVEANTITPASQNTIASLVHHVIYWNGVIVQRMRNHDPEIPAANGFDGEAPASEKDWRSLIEQARHSFVELADAIKQFEPARLSELTNFGQSTFSKNLFGIVEHAHYHLGQIMILKKFVKHL